MEMIEVKTAELIGPALDWAVAKAVGTKIDDSRGKELRIDVGAGFQSPWIPSVNWYQVGPMIFEHKIEFRYVSDSVVRAVLASGAAFTPIPCGLGFDHLVAACRAIVSAKLGDTVSVPRELMQ